VCVCVCIACVACVCVLHMHMWRVWYVCVACVACVACYMCCVHVYVCVCMHVCACRYGEIVESVYTRLNTITSFVRFIYFSYCSPIVSGPFSFSEFTKVYAAKGCNVANERYCRGSCQHFAT